MNTNHCTVHFSWSELDNKCPLKYLGFGIWYSFERDGENKEMIFFKERKNGRMLLFKREYSHNPCIGAFKHAYFCFCPSLKCAPMWWKVLNIMRDFLWWGSWREGLILVDWLFRCWKAKKNWLYELWRFLHEMWSLWHFMVSNWYGLDENRTRKDLFLEFWDKL